MNKGDEKVLRVGSRKSELALIQTKHVISELQKLYPEKKFEIHTMSTIGDRILNVSLPKIGEKSLFTRDLEDALKHGRVDFIVHSLKDLPTTLPQDMTIGAILEREDSRDALVLSGKYKDFTLQTLPKNSVIGTSSLRRTAQIRRKYPHLQIHDIRGNLNTRLAKLDAPNSKFAGIILAQAGLVRMGWTNRISQILDTFELLYCVGQGALAVECRIDDYSTLTILKNLISLPTLCKILAERSFLKTLGGGCSAPVAVSSKITLESINCKSVSSTILSLCGAVWSLDGKTEIMDEVKCSLEIKKRTKSEESSTTEDEDDLEVRPAKRSRFDKNSVNDNEEEAKRESPKIISDDPILENMKDGVMPNLQHLIEVHGQLFKKCPFYSLHKMSKENGSTSSTKDECPLKIPIGNDFMGLCPYADTQDKVELSEKGMCPITQTSIADSPNKNETVIDDRRKTLAYDEKNGNTLKCPFLGKATSSDRSDESKKMENNKNLTVGSEDDFENSTLSDKNSNIGHGSCPFLRKVKLIDHSDEGKSNEVIERSLSPELLENECKDLFCGIYRHKCFDKKLFKRCDDVGRNLANNLINKGALEIMKVAQEEIRKNAT